jgi:hypothetical protein
VDALSAPVANSSKIDGSSFSGLLTRVEIGQIRIGSAAAAEFRESGVA